MVSVKVGEHVAIAAKEEASERTRERIASKGTKGFIIRERLDSHKAFAGGPALLLESLVDGRKRGDRWMGWLPLDEISAIGPWGM